MFKLFSTLCLGLCSTFIWAQVDLEVKVQDQRNAQALPQIRIKLINPLSGFESEKFSNAQGKVRFVSLPVREGYKVIAMGNEDYDEAQSKDINLQANANASVLLFLAKKSNIDLDEIIVRANSSTQINTLNGQVSSRLASQEIQTLPVEGRDITRLLYRLPNVSQATGFYPEAPTVSINGANSLFTNYMIDGMDNNERFLGGQKFAIPIGFAQNIEVLSNNFSAEYGWTGNGVVNISTRSGGNELSGEAFLINRPGPALDAASPFAQRDLSGNLVKDGFQRYQAGFALGGALKEDRSFFYLNLEHTLDLKDNLLRVPDLNVNESIRGRNNFTYFSAKLDHKWNTHYRSSLRVNLGKVSIERQGGGLDGGSTFPSAANQQDRNSILIALKNTYNKGNFTWESNYQYARFRWNYGKALDSERPQVSVLGPNDQSLAILGHPGFIFDERENTHQFQEKIAVYLDKHTLNFGLELISADHQLLGGGNENGNYTVRLNQNQLDDLSNANLGSALRIQDLPLEVEVLNYTVELRPQSFGKRQNLYSFYIEDEISASARLNIHLGLRFDYDNLSKGGNQKGDWNNISPRFSWNYTLNQRSSLRGAYGIFYDKIPYAVYSDALQQNTRSQDFIRQLQALIELGILPQDTDVNRVTFEGNLGASLDNVNYLQGPSPASLQSERQSIFSNERRILNPNGYQNPLTHQISLGYQFQVAENVLFYADLVHNRSQNLFRLRNLNAPAPYPLNDPASVLIRTSEEADASRPIPIESDNTAFIEGQFRSGVARNVIVSESEGKSRYYAASFNLQKATGKDKYAYRLIYTLSFLENNTEDINFRAQDANNFENEWGPSINDRRHILNGIFYYYPLEGLSFSLAALIQSGQAINRIPEAFELGFTPNSEGVLVDANGNPFSTDLNGDGRSFGEAYVGNSDRFPGESRNNDRLPWSNNFDLGIQYQFKISAQTKLELRADIFNLFNAENLSGYANNANQSNQIQAGSRASGVLVQRNAGAPRQFQFGLRFLF